MTRSPSSSSGTRSSAVTASDENGSLWEKGYDFGRRDGYADGRMAMAKQFIEDMSKNENLLADLIKHGIVQTLRETGRG
jgi:hypothetical protein